MEDVVPAASGLRLSQSEANRRVVDISESSYGYRALSAE